VLNDHNLWQRNKDQAFANKISYPSIDKQEYAVDIFKFIDQVRLAPTNNGFFGFRFTKEIFEFLRKQWAAMFFEYLQGRSLNRQLASTNETLASLSAASDKIEEIVRNIYKNVDAAGAAESLTTIDLDSRARELFFTIAARTGDRQYLFGRNIKEMVEHPPSDWSEFFKINGFFELTEVQEDDLTPSIVLKYNLSDIVVVKVTGKLNKLQKAEVSYFAEGYAAYLQLSPEARERIIRENLYIHPTPE
jgi:hypothetical protein